MTRAGLVHHEGTVKGSLWSLFGLFGGGRGNQFIESLPLPTHPPTNPSEPVNVASAR